MLIIKYHCFIVDNVEISPDGSMLTISSAQPANQGAYRCVASNPYGVTHSIASLIVRGMIGGTKYSNITPAFIVLNIYFLCDICISFFHCAMFCCFNNFLYGLNGVWLSSIQPSYQPNYPSIHLASHLTVHTAIY